MNLWKFSEENALTFHRIIENIENDSPPESVIKNDFRDVFGTAFQTNPPSTVVDPRNFLNDQIEVISISSDESFDGLPNENPGDLNISTENPNASTSLVLSTIASESENEDAIKYFIDTLEAGRKLSAEDIDHLNNLDAKNLCTVLEKFTQISPNGVSNLICSICQTGGVGVRDDLIEKVCEILLIPAIMDAERIESCEKSLMALIELKKDAFEFICDKILVPLIQKQDKSFYLINSVIKTLSDMQRQTLLRKLLEKIEKPTTYDFSIIQILFSGDIDGDLIRTIISLMYKSRKIFNTDKIFGKLVSTVIQSLNPSFSDIYHMLESIVSENKTIFRRSSEKFLSEIFQTV